MNRLGFLHLFGPQDSLAQTFQRGLADLGYIEGRNMTIESRFGEETMGRMPELAAELVSSKVDVIAAIGAVGARAARAATAKIPIVFAAVIDPVAVGFAVTLARPGGNITGITSFDPEQPAKQFALLKQMLPSVERVAILSDRDIPDSPADPGWNPLERANDTAARALGLQPHVVKIKGPGPDLDGAFDAMAKQGAEALLVLEVPVTFVHRETIAERATRRRLPTLVPGGYGNAGGLITYGTSIIDTVARLPIFVDQILRGGKPADMPIEVITRRELIINLRTARQIGVTVPTEVLKRANKVIE